MSYLSHFLLGIPPGELRLTCQGDTHLAVRQATRHFLDSHLGHRLVTHPDITLGAQDVEVFGTHLLIARNGLGPQPFINRVAELQVVLPVSLVVRSDRHDAPEPEWNVEQAVTRVRDV